MKFQNCFKTIWKSVGLCFGIQFSDSVKVKRSQLEQRNNPKTSARWKWTVVRKSLTITSRGQGCSRSRKSLTQLASLMQCTGVKAVMSYAAGEGEADSSKLCESLLHIMSTGTHVVNITITFAPAGRRWLTLEFRYWTTSLDCSPVSTNIRMYSPL